MFNVPVTTNLIKNSKTCNKLIFITLLYSYNIYLIIINTFNNKHLGADLSGSDEAVAPGPPETGVEFTDFNQIFSSLKA
jgi:hypothetical protein